MMGYFNSMWRILKIEERIYQEIFDHGLSPRYATINVFVLGLLYGLFSVYFLSPDLFGDFPDTTSILVAKSIVVGVGIFVVFLLHLGTAFLFWTFCRAMGGETRFFPTYFNLGIAVIPLWLAIPGFTAMRAGWYDPIIAVSTLAIGIYTFALLFMAAKSTFGYSFKKMCIAMVMMLIFTISFLALWLG